MPTSCTIEALSYREKLLLSAIARTGKLGGTRPFSEGELAKKKVCRTLPIHEVLVSLAQLGVVVEVDSGKHLWRVLDTRLEHECEKWFLERKYPGITRIIRR